MDTPVPVVAHLQEEIEELQAKANDLRTRADDAEAELQDAIDELWAMVCRFPKDRIDTAWRVLTQEMMSELYRDR